MTVASKPSKRSKKDKTKTKNIRALIREVEQLGELREQIGRLKSSEREISDRVQTAMQAGALTNIESAAYVAQLAEARKLTIDVRKLKASLSKKDPKVFLDCVRPDLTACRRHLSPERLERLADVEKSLRLRISRRPGR